MKETIRERIRKISADAVGGFPLKTILEIMLTECVIAALRRSNGNVSAAAKSLGVHRNTLHRHMRELGISATGYASEGRL